MYTLTTLVLSFIVSLIVASACAPLSYLGISSRAKSHNKPAGAAQKQACTKDCEYKIEGEATATIHAAMQRKFLVDFLKNRRYQFAYALFSYSGWSDSGQIMILTDKKATNGRLIYAPPNKTTYSITMKFSNKQLMADLMPKFETFSSLPDFTPKVLDGIEYEYLRAERRNAKTAIVHDRVYMRIPHTSKDPRYRVLISHFNKFKDRLLKAQKPPKTL